MDKNLIQTIASLVLGTFIVAVSVAANHGAIGDKIAVVLADTLRYELGGKYTIFGSNPFTGTVLVVGLVEAAFVRF